MELHIPLMGQEHGSDKRGYADLMETSNCRTVEEENMENGMALKVMLVAFMRVQNGKTVV